MKYIFQKIIVLILFLCSNVAVANDPDQAGADQGNLQDAPIDDNLIWLFIAAFIFVCFQFNKKSKKVVVVFCS